jgi:hypothetical protein
MKLPSFLHPLLQAITSDENSHRGEKKFFCKFSGYANGPKKASRA